MNNALPSLPTTVRVISMRGRNGVVPPGAVYVGRSMRFFGLPLDASPFANPYTVKRHGDALSLFAQHLRRRRDIVDRIRVDLRGKVLACWCAPGPCHADILVRVADGGEP